MVKIMIVDDNKTFRVALRHLLEINKNYEIVCEAENGKQAVQLLDSYVPELVLMDIEMPIMNGIQAAKQMLWENTHLKLIAITMYKEKAYIDEIISAGFRACIFKSEVFDTIDRVIKNVIENKYDFPKDMKINH